jgi:hypothetical protein
MSSVGIDAKKFDVIAIQNELIATKETIDRFQIGEGDDVFFIGLFTHHIGTVKNQLIVRFGKVALISDEKIQSPDTLEDLYLMECESYAANSGSPVFFYISLTRHPVFLQQRDSRRFLGRSFWIPDRSPLRRVSQSSHRRKYWRASNGLALTV